MAEEPKTVSLEAVLDERERRARRQTALLRQHGRTLISLTMNLAGPVKTGPLPDACFDSGVAAVRDKAGQSGFGILHFEETESPAGRAAFFVVDAPALAVKRLACAIEGEHPAGRLLDIDVLDTDGEKLTRRQVGEGPRRCLVCHQPAAQCARSRAHGLDAVMAETEKLLRRWAAEEAPV
ncbi:citrate lyase holo-[acyl-carrier protein] synthase [Ruminococcaceae bacterium OttesenSCG-928-A11]|nr:citrate lyase holo-[acyl-carrier protein] synthase [Ruminococcaceae bacterium OttesenSCG-928-A11]